MVTDLLARIIALPARLAVAALGRWDDWVAATDDYEEGASDE